MCALWSCTTKVPVQPEGVKPNEGGRLDVDVPWDRREEMPTKMAAAISIRIRRRARPRVMFPNSGLATPHPPIAFWDPEGGLPSPTGPRLGPQSILPRIDQFPGMCDYEEEMEEWVRLWRTRASADSLKEEPLEELRKVIPSPMETSETPRRRPLALRH
jgi:hypothetical protein